MNTFSGLLAGILLPPFGFIAMALLGVVMLRRRPKLGRILTASSLGLLSIVSTPAFNFPFLNALSWPPVGDLSPDSGVQAIVVLGGGLSLKSPEYRGADTVNARTLNRLRYAAWLWKQTRLPVLTAGGRKDPKHPAEAELMKATLETELGTPVRWTETESRNTFENARESARILLAAGVTKAYLVTHSSHMRRAVDAFAPTGLTVIPAPIEGFWQDQLSWSDFVPSPVGFQTSYNIAHELLGRAWYWLRSRFGDSRSA